MLIDLYKLSSNLIVLAVLLVLSAFFSGSEVALFSLNKIQLEKFRERDRFPNKVVYRLVERPHRLLITILSGNALANTALTSLISSVTVYVWGDEAVGLAVAISTVFLLVFGEILPKSIAIKDPELFSRIFAIPLDFFSKLLSPARAVLELLSNGLVRIIVPRNRDNEDTITEEEIQTAIEIAEEEGFIEEQEKVLITTIFDLSNITASEIMVPRTEMVCASTEMTLQQLFEQSIESGHSRIPIYEESIDNILGIAYIRDFPNVLAKNLQDLSIKEYLNLPEWQGVLIMKPFYVPKTRTVLGLLQDFRENKVQMAILLDEYGGTAGLVTISDIIKELVGELGDSRYGQTDDFTIVDEVTSVVSGKTTLRNINKKLDTNLPEQEDVDTIGGYIASIIGYVPKKGELINDIEHNLVFEILSSDEKRIEKVKIKKMDKQVSQV